MKNEIGNILLEWRKRHRYSQLQLALELAISSKHICFLETGRSKPSREMILKLGNFLGIPKREINRALHAAGFAPAYTDLPLSHTTLAPVLAAIDQMLESHAPYPAIVLNQHWDVVKTNKTATMFLAMLGYDRFNNLIEALVADSPQHSKITNWYNVVASLHMRLRVEMAATSAHGPLAKLERALAERLKNYDQLHTVGIDQATLTTQVKLDNQLLTFFSIIASLGTIQDVSISEYKVELLFPSDEHTTLFCQRLQP